MMRAAILALALVAAPACAEVMERGPDGFVSRSKGVLVKPPAEVWAALTSWRWWDPAHSYSGRPGVLVLEPKAGGTLSESWDGNSVWHATVVNAMPPKLLRMHGGFGPLQGLPVNAVLDFVLAPTGTGTTLTMTYRVGGPATAKLDTLAGPVDGVMSAGFARLVQLVNDGTIRETR
jgi:uncharacterized protein YndB with AHSA1/START domain